MYTETNETQTSNETETPVVTARKPRVSAEALIGFLNQANSISEAATLSGLTENNIHQRRHQLSLKGVKVKQYTGARGGNRLDLAKLNEVSAATLPEGAEVFVATTRPKVEAPQAPTEGA